MGVAWRELSSRGAGSWFHACSNLGNARGRESDARDKDLHRPLHTASGTQ